MSERQTGTVKWFDDTKGFGFILPDDGSKDLFVHKSSIQSEGFQSLSEGESVEYNVECGDDGRAQAFDVSGPEGAPVQGSHGGGGGRYHAPKSQRRPYRRGHGGGGGRYGYLPYYMSVAELCEPINSILRRVVVEEGMKEVVVEEEVVEGVVAATTTTVNCGESGHFARECPTGGGGGGC